MDDSTLFLVRVWQHEAPGFKACARRVDGEDTALFREPQALLAFLRQATAAHVPAGPAQGAAPEEQP